MTSPPPVAGTPLPFGTLSTGEEVLAYSLANRAGMRVRVLDYGGIVQSLWVPDRRGELADVVLGFDELAEYPLKSQYFGSIVGRCANRIARGRFRLDGTSYHLATNDDPNHLHGGVRGFDKRVWQGEQRGPGSLVLTLTSPDGDQGYPGEVTVTVTYTVTDDNALRIDYRATTTAPTVVNLTNHSYFNLGGAGHGTVLDHVLTTSADRFTPTDATNIPSGELRPVAGTPFDFTVAKPVGADIDRDDEQLRFGSGYDHNYVLKDRRDGVLAEGVARVVCPRSGRVLEVSTTEPGLQVYSGNHLTGMQGKGGLSYPPRGALCLEAQTFPDAPNQPGFPSAVLRPGEAYEQTTVYRFSVE
jgi:aldose 1-epimerase